jgi:hypothetical protein
MGSVRVRVSSLLWVPVLLVLGGLLWLALTFFGPVDRCLDRGGCWDSVHDRCELKDDAHCESGH